MEIISKVKKSVFVTAMLAIAGLGIYGITVYADGPSLSACERAWASSGASNSCGLAQVHNVLATISVVGDDCKVNVDCSTSTYGNYRNQTWQGSVDDMARLNNCNGYLKVQDC